MIARLAIVPFVAAALSAIAVDSAQWPPPPEVLGRMRDLQARIVDPATSKDERAAARKELEGLMKSPRGQDVPTVSARPARAAIDPFPSVVKPSDTNRPAPPTARLEVTEPPVAPPRPLVNPRTGSVLQPSPSASGIAIDARTGRVLQETPYGFIDPRNGHLIPK